MANPLTVQDIAKQRADRARSLGLALAQSSGNYIREHGRDAKAWSPAVNKAAELEDRGLWQMLATEADSDDPAFMDMVESADFTDAEIETMFGDVDLTPVEEVDVTQLVQRQPAPTIMPARKVTAPATPQRSPVTTTPRPPRIPTQQEIAQERMAKRVQDFFAQPPAAPLPAKPKAVQAPAVALPDDPNPTGAR